MALRRDEDAPAVRAPVDLEPHLQVVWRDANRDAGADGNDFLRGEGLHGSVLLRHNTADIFSAVTISPALHLDLSEAVGCAILWGMAPGRGRPPAGRDARGEPVAVTKGYVQLTLRVPPESKAVIDSLAVIEQKGQANVVDDAVTAYVASLPVGTRRAVEELKAAKLASRSAPRRAGSEKH